MKRFSRVRRTGVSLAAAAAAFSIGSLGAGGPASIADAAPVHPGPILAGCAFPTAPSATPEETAWKLFVAANCPASGGKVVWETWVEQLQLYRASAGGPQALTAVTPRRLHGSPLAHALASKTGLLSVQLTPGVCNTMNGPPPNVVAKEICEEARLNPEAAGYVTRAGYDVRTGQMTAAKQKRDIQFPAPAIEVKIDWIPATDFKPAFSCASPPPGVHVETIDGVCYAMAGMHISSKLLKNWLWATFEPQSMLTNPLRCITFGKCEDRWGSVPAASNGGASGFTRPSPALQTLMTQARLAPEFANYRLDGAQIAFGTAAKPTLLGNSVIEGENVGMTKGTASCISCHSGSSIKTDGTDKIASLSPLVGVDFRPPAGWIARDFVWSLAFACPDPTHTGAQACTTPKP